MSRNVIICDSCRHVLPHPKSYMGYACKAFPEGVPYEIMSGMMDHIEPFPGDHGIQYAVAQGKEHIRDMYYAWMISPERLEMMQSMTEALENATPEEIG